MVALVTPLAKTGHRSMNLTNRQANTRLHPTAAAEAEQPSTANRVLVLAVTHAKRKPLYWLTRGSQLQK